MASSCVPEKVYKKEENKQQQQKKNKKKYYNLFVPWIGSYVGPMRNVTSVVVISSKIFLISACNVLTGTIMGGSGGSCAIVAYQPTRPFHIKSCGVTDPSCCKGCSSKYLKKKSLYVCENILHIILNKVSLYITYEKNYV